MVIHWRHLSQPESRRNMLINGIGAVATGLTLLVVLVAKFTEGAWLTFFLIPILLVIFLAVRKHYVTVTREIACGEQALDLRDLQPPIVVVPIKDWNQLARKGLRFALKLSPDVYAVQVRESEQMVDLEAHWSQLAETPAQAAGLTPPKLVVIDSPFRQLARPLISYITTLKDQHPDRQIAVIIPDLVEHRWYHYLLHNQQGDVLKAWLLVQGDQRIVVINVPWYLSA